MEAAETTSETMEQEIVSVRVPKRLKQQLSVISKNKGKTVNKMMAELIRGYCDGNIVDKEMYLSALHHYWDMARYAFEDDEEVRQEFDEDERDFLIEVEDKLLERGNLTEEDELFFEHEDQDDDEEEDEEDDEDEEMTKEEIQAEIKEIEDSFKRSLNKTEERELIDRQLDLFKRLHNLS
jgi:predicted DNA-binding protein